jgi:TetR/AcrR family tetracycline transcriptional repressor
MLELGFDAVMALRTITAVTNYVNGFVLQEQSTHKPSAATPTLTFEMIGELLPDGYHAPLLVAFAQGGSPYSEDSFEFGLQALIYGVAMALASKGNATLSAPGPGRR